VKGEWRGGRRVAVVGFASQVRHIGDGSNDAELLGPVIDEAVAASGLSRSDIGVVCSASSEFGSGIVGSMMEVFDVLPCWPPVTHSHLEGEGAFALGEAWVRLLAGEADVALVCAYSRPLARDLPSVLTLQLDPYLVAPLAPDSHEIAALQARALIDGGRYAERDFATVVSARRPGLTVDAVLAQPYIASPLREPDCSTTACAGTAALVLAADAAASRALERPAWIAGLDHRVETGALGARDLTRSASTEAAAAHLGLRGSAIDVLEVHAPYSHQELIITGAIGASHVGALNPSGGVLPADPLGVSGLIRIGAAASTVSQGDARRAVGHATNGPCLQQNLLCVLERDQS
jgi:acetyl-CoA acetyltransferase